MIRRVYNYQCITCGATVTMIWQSDRLPTDEEIPMQMDCNRYGCVGKLDRARPVKIGPKAVGLGYMNHDAHLVIDIDPDLLSIEEQQALRPDQAAIVIRIPERKLHD